MYRLIKILHLVRKYSNSLKKLPKNYERFILLKEPCHNPVFICIFKFLLCVANGLEPVLKLFQLEHPLTFFMYERLKEMMIALVMRFVKPVVLASANSRYKLLKLYLINKSNLLSTLPVKVGFGQN